MRPHRTSWSSLVFGVIFAAAGVLLVTNGVNLLTRLDWIGPLLLIVVALCLFASAVVDRPRSFQGPPPMAPPATWGGAPQSSAAGSPPGGAETSGGEPPA